MYNPYDFHAETAHQKRLQVIYLGLKDKLPPKKISNYVDYAISTIRNYLWKFKNLLEEAISFFAPCVEIIQKVPDFPKDVDRCYEFKFYNEEKLLFTKIGTTKRKATVRLKEEIKSYRKAGFHITKVVIESIIDCGEIPSEGAESFARAIFIKKYPNTFLKNDRFLGVDIPVEFFNKVIFNYFETAAALV